MSELQTTLKQGAPYLGMDALIPKQELKRYTEGAVQASLVAHRALYEALREGNPRVIIFGDVHSGEEAKFVSLADKLGNPCYDRFEPTHAATDIGLRGVNPDFDGKASTVTIVHANTHTAEFFKKRGAPTEVINAVDAMAQLNHFAIKNIAKPFLEEIAETYGLSAEEYIEIFYPSNGDWERTVTRGIFYHSNINPSQRPIGSDKKALGGKEHFDQSGWTFKLKESGPGFEWLDKSKSTPQWTSVDDDKVAVFRSRAEAYLPVEAPPCAHRAVYDAIANEMTPEMLEAKVSRWAAVTFASSSLKNAVAVRAKL